MTRDLAGALSRLRTAEKRRRRLERRLARVPKPANVGIAHIDVGGRIISATERFCEIVGSSQAELAGRNISELTHPSDTGADADQYRRLLAGELDGYAVEKRYIKRDGSIVWGRLSITLPRDVTSRPMYQVRVLTDITREREIAAARDEAMAEVERLRGLLDERFRSVKAGATVIEAETGAVLYYNSHAVEILGLSLRNTREVVTYAAIFEAIDVRYPDGSPCPADADRLTRTLIDGEHIRGWELLGRRPDGRHVRLTVDAVPVRGRHGRVTLALVTILEPLYRSPVGRVSEALEEEAEIALQARREIFQYLDHGSRGPLATIKGLAEELLLGIPEPIGQGASDHVRRIEGAGQTLRQLIDDVVLLGRSGIEEPIDPPGDSFDAAELLNRIADGLAPVANSWNVKVSRKRGMASDAMIATDRRRLKSLLSALSACVLHLGRDGRADIGLERVGRELRFELRAEGPAATPEVLKELYAPRLSPADQGPSFREKQGMGLSLVAHLAFLLGGEVRTESDDGVIGLLLVLPMNSSGESSTADPVPDTPLVEPPDGPPFDAPAGFA